MKRIMLKSKLHRATVTDLILGYDGSLGIDADLMAQADVQHGEQVHVYNITNGQRFVTYAVPEAAGSRKIVVMGAAARLASAGDLVIIASYAHYSEAELADYRPRVVVLGADNVPKQ